MIENRVSCLRVAGHFGLCLALMAMTMWNPAPARAGQRQQCNEAYGGGCSPGGDPYDFSMLHGQTQMTQQQRAAFLSLANKAAWTKTDVTNAAAQLRSAADTMRAITFTQMDRFTSANFQTLLQGITPQQERNAYNKLVAMGYTKSFATYDAFVKKAASLMKDGVDSYGSQGFYNAFLALADVLEAGEMGVHDGEGMYLTFDDQRGVHYEFGQGTCNSLGIASAAVLLYAAVIALVPGGQGAAALCGVVGAGLALAYSTC